MLQLISFLVDAINYNFQVIELGIYLVYLLGILFYQYLIYHTKFPIFWEPLLLWLGQATRPTIIFEDAKYETNHHRFAYLKDLFSAGECMAALPLRLGISSSVVFLRAL